ncbi:MAG: aldo/keto reductase [Chloroflexi bacterium]|nr:aldo/keto reductase [Chloroflexota bacterium]
MESATLGSTGLKVSRLGLGLAEIGDLSLNDLPQAASVLNLALDNGITFLDTSACYGNSEELVGNAVAHRRNEYVLATKCGHVSGGYEGQDWTASTVRDSIDRSLVRLKTDHLDLVQLHSCDLDTLKRGDATEALLRAKEAGKTRFVGYSGDNEEARWAVESGLFDTLQTSFNLVDQHARSKGLLDLAEERGMGIIAKRPIANGVWGALASSRPYTDDYFKRARVLAGMGRIKDAPGDAILLALGFVLAHPAITTAIVGTSNPDHLLANIRSVESGLSLRPDVLEELYDRFDLVGGDWLQLE